MFKHNTKRSVRDVEQNRAFVFCVVGPRPERHARIDSKAPSFISDPGRVMMWSLKPNSLTTAEASHPLTIKQCNIQP